jgi:hypothetical protein
VLEAHSMELRQRLLSAKSQLFVSQGKQYDSAAAFSASVAAATAALHSSEEGRLEREQCYPLTSASKSGELMAARCLIQELQSPVFESALFAALLYGHLKVSMLLLDEGAQYQQLVQYKPLYPTATSTTLADYKHSVKSALATKIGDGNAQDEVCLARRHSIPPPPPLRYPPPRTHRPALTLLSFASPASWNACTL